MNKIINTGQTSVVSHDWRAYLLITAVGGTVIYDSNPTIRYRQHSRNHIGCNTSWTDRLFRIHMLLKGRFRHWNTRNLTALNQIPESIPIANKKILEHLCSARELWLIPRILRILQSGIYRQTSLGNIRLFIEILLKKI